MNVTEEHDLCATKVQTQMNIKKTIILLCILVFCEIPYAHPEEPEGTPIPILRDTGIEYSVPPKAPGIAPLNCFYYSAVSTIITNFHYDLGLLSVEIENHTTGEYDISNVNVLAGTMAFPISGTPGHWLIRFTLPSGVQYYGEFDI